MKRVFDYKRETKRTRVFEERLEGVEPMIGVLYVSKKALEQLGGPDVITVTIESGLVKDMEVTARTPDGK